MEDVRKAIDVSTPSGTSRRLPPTWYDIHRVHGILVFDESKAIHDLDLRDLGRPMSLEVLFHLGLGDYPT